MTRAVAIVLTRLGLRFQDQDQEKRFQSYYTDRVYALARFSALLAALTFAVYGIWDMTAQGGGVAPTRFRYMIACPIMFGLFGLMFFDAVRRHWQTFCVVYLTVASGLVYGVLVHLNRETAFTFSIGTATVNFSLIEVFVCLFPMSFAYTLVALAAIQFTHAHLLMTQADFPPMILAGNIFNTAAIAAIVAFVAFYRERLMRSEFETAVRLRDETEAFKSQLVSYVSLDALERARTGGKSIADSFGEVTVFFCDIVGFTLLAEKLAPKHLVELLGQVFCAIDELAAINRVEKVKTIGDAYMAVAGTVDGDGSPAEDVAEFALAVMRAAKVISQSIGYPLTFRIGMHTGSLIGGVIGQQRMSYDYWGRTVNIAARLEATSLPGHIQVSEATYWRIRRKYRMEKRGDIELKGVGEVTTYFLTDRPAACSSGDGDLDRSSAQSVRQNPDPPMPPITSD